MCSDELYMSLALEEASFAYDADEVPVGCIIVCGERVIARAHNLRETLKSPVAHAEIEAIMQAAGEMPSWRLEDCTIYVTLEPCPMCAGAIINSRISKVVFGAYDKKAGAFGTLYNLAEGRLNHTPEVLGGVMEAECAGILSKYFKEKRRGKNGVQKGKE